MLFVGVLATQAPPTAASVTEQTRTLAHALDTVLAARADQADTSQRAVLFVVDPTTSVAESGFAKELAAAVKRGAAELADARVALFVPGDKPRKVAVTT